MGMATSSTLGRPPSMSGPSAASGTCSSRSRAGRLGWGTSDGGLAPGSGPSASGSVSQPQSLPYPARPSREVRDAHNASRLSVFQAPVRGIPGGSRLHNGESAGLKFRSQAHPEIEACVFMWPPKSRNGTLVISSKIACRSPPKGRVVRFSPVGQPRRR